MMRDKCGTLRDNFHGVQWNRMETYLIDSTWNFMETAEY